MKTIKGEILMNRNPINFSYQNEEIKNKILKTIRNELPVLSLQTRCSGDVCDACSSGCIDGCSSGCSSCPNGCPSGVSFL